MKGGVTKENWIQRLLGDEQQQQPWRQLPIFEESMRVLKVIRYDIEDDVIIAATQ